VLFLILLTPGARRVRQATQALALLGLVYILGLESIVPQWSWSPYYKIELT
jgi:hypothetical protein